MTLGDDAYVTPANHGVLASAAWSDRHGFMTVFSGVCAVIVPRAVEDGARLPRELIARRRLATACGTGHMAGDAGTRRFVQARFWSLEVGRELLGDAPQQAELDTS